MGNIDDEVSALRKKVDGLKNHISQINFNVLRLLSEIQKLGSVSVDSSSGSGGEVTSSLGGSAVDLGPVEERLEELLSMREKEIS